MIHTSNKLAVGIWGFLTLATVATAWLAEHLNIAGEWTIAVVMLVAALKSRALILHYMELKQAPLPWRIAFELWAWACPIIITAFWFLSR